jgi:hypothetical protein
VGDARVGAGGSRSLTVWDAIFSRLYLVNSADGWPQLRREPMSPVVSLQQFHILSVSRRFSVK